ncbi:MAG: hypothetical protein CMF50_04865 [Legionellales bacterium]|nr:hypothetical protein [Legionellales bacterium]
MNLAQQPQPAKALLKDCYRAFGYLLKPLIPTLLMCIGLILVYVTAGFFLVSAVGEILHQPTLATILFYLYVAFYFVVALFCLTAIYNKAFDTLQGRDLAYGSMWRIALKRCWRMTGAYIILALAIFLPGAVWALITHFGFAAFPALHKVAYSLGAAIIVVVFAFIAVRFLLTLPLIAIDGEHLIQGLKHSFQMTKGLWLRYFCVFLLGVLLPCVVISSLADYLQAIPNGEFLATAVQYLVTIFGTVLLVGGNIVLLNDAKLRNNT